MLEVGKEYWTKSGMWLCIHTDKTHNVFYRENGVTLTLSHEETDSYMTKAIMFSQLREGAMFRKRSPDNLQVFTKLILHPFLAIVNEYQSHEEEILKYVFMGEDYTIFADKNDFEVIPLT